jgi:hypothetical protein
MVGEIISEWWATSNRNGGRDHSGMVGDIERNQRPTRRRITWPAFQYPLSLMVHLLSRLPCRPAFI